MCQAPVLRFSCGHGILMDIELCSVGPCPMLKTAAAKMTAQPFRCYNCQRKRGISNASQSSAGRSSSSSVGSLDAPMLGTTLLRTHTIPSAPLPGVARQPGSSVQYGMASRRGAPVLHKSFSFTCANSEHSATPHYAGLPSHLPHQDHACPPCRLENLRQQSDLEVTTLAKSEFPCLRGEMLVRNGRIREDWEGNLTLEKYIDERRTEDKQMWFNVTRKWTQDLKKARILVGEEDGLGLMQ